MRRKECSSLRHSLFLLKCLSSSSSVSLPPRGIPPIRDSYARFEKRKRSRNSLENASAFLHDVIKREVEQERRRRRQSRGSGTMMYWRRTSGISVGVRSSRGRLRRTSVARHLTRTGSGSGRRERRGGARTFSFCFHLFFALSSLEPLL